MLRSALLLAVLVSVTACSGSDLPAANNPGADSPPASTSDADRQAAAEASAQAEADAEAAELRRLVRQSCDEAVRLVAVGSDQVSKSRYYEVLKTNGVLSETSDRCPRAVVSLQEAYAAEVPAVETTQPAPKPTPEADALEENPPLTDCDADLSIIGEEYDNNELSQAEYDEILTDLYTFGSCSANYDN